MLQYERIDTSNGINLYKTDKSKECEVCHHKYFNRCFEFDSKVCNDCNREIIAFKLKNLATVFVRGIGYKVFMFDMTEDNVHNILGDFQSSEL